METLIKVYLNNILTRTRMSYNLKELENRILLVKVVLRLVKAGVTGQEIIERLGLNPKDQSIVSRICQENGVSIRQLRTNLCAAKRQKEKAKLCKLREEKRRAKICAMSNMYIDGRSTGEIANMFECSLQNVCDLFQKEYGKDWKEILKAKRKPRIKVNE